MGHDEGRRRFLQNAAKGLGAAVITTQFGSMAPAQSGWHLLPRYAQPRLRFAIHGGAGTILRSEMSAEKERQYRAKLSEALLSGYAILKKGGPGLDAVETAIRLLEDSPLFNAGKGAVFTNAGTNELDASIMDGKTLKAGAVASLKQIKNPISLARLVMEKSRHVLMVGAGAEAFARQQGVGLVPQSYFHTEPRWKALQREKAEEEKRNKEQKPRERGHASDTGHEHGTVGAVALDQGGNIAAGTSTGGMTNKRFGRVGDSPIIGAGTYANNETCGISATGDGEYFIRLSVAHDLSALMEYRGFSVKEAADAVIEKVGKLGGRGGLIAIDKAGNVAMSFNTSGMYRGRIGADGEPVVEIYSD